MRMKLFGILALGWISPGIAQIAVVTPNYNAMTDDELIEHARAITNDAFRDPCGNNRRLFEELSRRTPSHAGYRAGILTAQALCALQERRYEDALSLVRQAESVQTVPILDKIGLDLAIQMKDGNEALARLRRIALDDRIGNLGEDFLFAGVRTVRSAGLNDEFDDFAYELTAASGYARLEENVQALLAVSAIRHAVRTADFSGVDNLLNYIPNTGEYREVLADPSFEAVRPALEKRGLFSLSEHSVDTEEVQRQVLTEPTGDVKVVQGMLDAFVSRNVVEFQNDLQDDARIVLRQGGDKGPDMVSLTLDNFAQAMKGCETGPLMLVSDALVMMMATCNDGSDRPPSFFVFRDGKIALFYPFSPPIVMVNRAQGTR